MSTAEVARMLSLDSMCGDDASPADTQNRRRRGGCGGQTLRTSLLYGLLNLVSKAAQTWGHFQYWRERHARIGGSNLNSAAAVGAIV